jgi:hypothetical protein
LPLEKKEQEKAAYLPFPVTEDSSDIPPMPHANASTPTKKIFIPVLFAAWEMRDFFFSFQDSAASELSVGLRRREVEVCFHTCRMDQKGARRSKRKCQFPNAASFCLFFSGCLPRHGIATASWSKSMGPKLADPSG